MADGVSVKQLRERARYRRLRAKGESDLQKQAEYRETAALLDREADALNAEYEELVTRRPQKRAGD